jgi:hypothetical protein
MRTTSRAAFNREAAEVAAEASEDALARDIARKVFRPAPRPRKRASRAIWAAHGAVVTGLIGGALLYPPASGVCALSAIAYLGVAGLLHPPMLGPVD